MNTTNRIIVNTIILYAKILVVMVINLWTVPLLLRALGQSDYGLYQLVAGVITMLTFINAAMTISTQRYMSVAMGKSDHAAQLNAIYNVSLLLHLIIGIGLTVVLELLTPFLFHGFLNIEPGRIGAAEWTYQFLIISTFFTILSVPFDAELNAYENMTVFAIISIIDAVLRLGIALALPYFSGDLLILYGAGMAAIALLNIVMKYGYTRKKYPVMYPCMSSINKATFKEMFGFAGWNTFGSLAIVGRNQGIAIVLNKFFGTIINASYGIANQINGLITYFSATLQKSINPQLMISEGMQNRERMLKIAFMSSKYSVLITLLLVIPLIIEMPYILELWLHEVPAYTVAFTRLTLIASIIYQLSAGLMSAIQSTGKIRTYQITMGVLLLLNIPISIVLLFYWKNPEVAFWTMILIEIICLFVRIAFAYRLTQADWKYFCRSILLPLGVTTLVCFMGIGAFAYITPSSIGLILVEYILSFIIIGALSWLWLLSNEEKNYILDMVRAFTKKIV